MNRKQTIAALAGVAALLTLGVATNGSAEQAQSSATIRVQSELTAMNRVDNAPAGESAGDLFVFTERLSRGGRRIGRITRSCVLVQPPALFECTFTAALAGGRLAVSEQADLTKKAFTGAITGGTGRYRRARGTVLVNVVGEGREVITFHVLD